MAETVNIKFVDETDSSARLIVEGAKEMPLIIGTPEIRAGFDEKCMVQARNIALAPGVEKLVIGADFHVGYGCLVGSTFASSTHVYPCAVGPDVKCSMSLLSIDLDASEIDDKRIRRRIMDEIGARIPTGCTNRQAPKARNVSRETLRMIAVEGASVDVLKALGIPWGWRNACEDASHGKIPELQKRFDELYEEHGNSLYEKLAQIGSCGAGNHFCEGSIVSITPGEEEAAKLFGLRENGVAMVTHCGSRGFGFKLSQGQFHRLENHFDKWGIALPGDERENVYAPLGTPEATNYLNDMYIGGNFATVNHLLINHYLTEAYDEVFNGRAKTDLVYYIAHNIIREEIVDNRPTLIHRKGATRAMPGNHHEVNKTKFAGFGHPIILPGNCTDGTAVMRGNTGAKKTLYSVNHGAGRRMGRREAKRNLDQKLVNNDMLVADVMYNDRNYPIDESPRAYKDFDMVIDSVVKADLATKVAMLKPRFVIKDADKTSQEG